VRQVLVLYAPPRQRAFGTVGLSAGDWLRCIAAASTVLWLREAAPTTATSPRPFLPVGASATTNGLPGCATPSPRA
jgi:hypothetical protein